ARRRGAFEPYGDAAEAGVDERLIEQREREAHGLIDHGARGGRFEQRLLAGAGERLAAEEADELEPESLGKRLAAPVAPAPDLVGGGVERASGAEAHGDDEREGLLGRVDGSREGEGLGGGLEERGVDALRPAERAPAGARVGEFRGPGLVGGGAQAHDAEPFGERRGLDED